MIRKLTQYGDSTYLVLDEKICQQLNVAVDTPMLLTVDGRRLIVEPLAEERRKQLIRDALQSTIQEFDEDLRRLAD